MKLNKAFKYRLLPSEDQGALIEKTFGCCRFIYNKMLSDKIEYYKETGLTLKNTPAQYKQGFEWLKEVDSYALCNEQVHLQTAYKNFFENKNTGFPKFKSKKYNKRSYTTSNVNGIIRMEQLNIIHLPKLGAVRLVEHRRIPKDYKIKSATISKTGSGKYYISILTEYEHTTPIIEVNKVKSIGIDYSSHGFYVDSQNISPTNYKHLYGLSESKLAKEQRRLSRMKSHSNNYNKQKIKVAKIHEKIANQRKNFIENLSNDLSRKYDIICVEDIDMKNISRSLKLGKSTMDNGFGIFRTRLQQKLEFLGKKMIKIDRWFPSSKMCRFCGTVNSDLKLSDREWDCCCGKHLLRDENAAINILNEGIRLMP